MKATPINMHVTAPAAPSCPAPARSADILSSPNPRVGRGAGRAIASERRRVLAEPLGHEGFISKRELARRLNKSLRTIVYWQRHGIIPYIKCGRSALFKWTDVLAHLEKNFRVCRQLPQSQPMNRLNQNCRKTQQKGNRMTNNHQPFLVTHSNRSRGFSNR